MLLWEAKNFCRNERGLICRITKSNSMYHHWQQLWKQRQLYLHEKFLLPYTTSTHKNSAIFISRFYLKVSRQWRDARNRLAIDMVATWIKFHYVSQYSIKKLRCTEIHKYDSTTIPNRAQPKSTYVPVTFVYYRLVHPRSRLPSRSPLRILPLPHTHIHTQLRQSAAKVPAEWCIRERAQP